MVTQTRPPGLTLVHQQNEPIVFSGPPGRVTGTLNLLNTSNEKLKLTTVRLDAPMLTGAARQPLGELRIAARIYPNQQGAVPVTLPLDPCTAPGSYTAHIRVGDHIQSVVIHVTEHVDLHVEPDGVAINTDGERKFTREFVVENAGNVALPLGDKCFAPLLDSLGLSGVIHKGLKGACDRKFEETMHSLLCAWSNQQVGLVSLSRDNVTLKPGEKRVMKGAFELPDDIQSYRHFVADFELFNAAIHLDVYTGKLKESNVVR
jgi:hypothetical protein